MTSQYRHRRTSNPSTTFPNPLEPGEIAVNTANRQLAAGDANSGTLGTPLALIALRFFDARAIYAANDLVFNAGVIYRAKAATGPGAFTPAQWDTIAGILDPRYVAKAGDTMTGTLTVNSATGPSLFSLNPTQAEQQAVISFGQTGAGKWGLGKQTNDTFFIYDIVHDNYIFYTSVDGTTVVFGRSVQLAADPTVALGAATKQYVDAKVQQSAGAASDVTVVPTGNISATNAQAALAELDTEKVKKSGDTMSGPLIVEPKGSTIGTAGGPPAPAAQPADANIKFYDFGGGNWAGIGIDYGGNMWIRTGLSGSPVAVTWADTQGFLHITKDPELDDHVANKRYVDSGGAGFLKTAGRQTINGGFRVAPYNLGSGTGTVQPEPYNGNYQYINNSAAFTIAAPTNDCAIDILITNVFGAGTVSFSGFFIGASAGDPMTNLVGARFIISIRRINAFSTYTVKQVS